jgi:AraC-like DNA-binding protein
MNYKQYDVTEELQPFIKCFWSLEELVSATADPQGAVQKQRIVPDGCMEMIFHYGDLYKQYMHDGSFIIQPRCFVFGQITSPLEIEPTGSTGIIAARFLPDGFLPFSSFPIQQMENKAVALHQLFGDDAIALEKTVLQTSTNEERIQIISTFLINRLQTAEVRDRITQSGIDALMLSNGQLNVDELAGQLQINRRQLERKFSSAIGLSPKQLSKFIRLQAALKMMNEKKITSLTSLAYENGFYDQAHFIKDFKEFTGVSPKDFYAGNLKMSALFTGIE